MRVKTIPYIIDSELTPQNATEQGYRFVDDIFNPYVAIQELIELADREGYVFGASTKGELKIGLYKRKG